MQGLRYDSVNRMDKATPLNIATRMKEAELRLELAFVKPAG